ncbi:MAG: hypothetical protein ABWZ42_03480 [Ilumatobacteraceae bacterium]
MDAQLARKTWRTLEPLHGAIYFAAEARQEYAALGIDDRMSGYFASRAAPMGAVPASVVIATFFNFDHGLVERSIDGVWDRVTPDAILAARLRAADGMIRRLAPEAVESDDMVEAADIARTAALVACEQPEGRPLFAGHANLPWPTEPHLVLWHAQSLLREFRGDGHVAALTVEGLSGCEALVTHGLAGEVPSDTLRLTRQRTDDDWAAAVESLRRRGWIGDDGACTELGRERRQWIEDRTDELSTAPYAAIGDDKCARLRAIARPWSVAMMAAIG